MKQKNYSVIGGDLRSLKLAELIRYDGNRVNIYGIKNANFKFNANDITESNDLNSAIDQSDIIIGPLPCSNDNETLNAPFHFEKIYMNEVFRRITRKQLFIAGRISNKLSCLAGIYNVCVLDILEREEMAILNAIPTAEGSIQIAMEEMPITLHNCNALILGFGRIGKLLAKMLKGIGSNVYVEARKYSDIAWIDGYGYNPIFINDIKNYVSNADVIFNTIPYLILDSEILNEVNKNTLIIDLASKPGGVDFDKAKDLGIKVIWALSLPGKVAPITAAKFIKDTIYNIIDELGV